VYISRSIPGKKLEPVSMQAVAVNRTMRTPVGKLGLANINPGMAYLQSANIRW
jgi:hypothetical protein